ncbi:hypothetical protein RIF29_25323 [Crotalaria pallida]|uniref:Uncharacterized protein n=1 Tax=Crotalaria pallida TaxID=3830 RepID=A0AAN9ERC3_CROPI
MVYGPKKVEFNETKPLRKLPKKFEFNEVKRVEDYCDDVDDECNSSANKNKGKEVYHPPIPVIAPAPKNGYASSTAPKFSLRQAFPQSSTYVLWKLFAFAVFAESI